MRTLLPSARHLTPTLAASAEEVICDGHHPTAPASCCVSSVHSNSGAPAAALADLPAETQAQIAHVLAALLRRMQANSPAIEESPRADRLERS